MAGDSGAASLATKRAIQSTGMILSRIRNDDNPVKEVAYGGWFDATMLYGASYCERTAVSNDSPLLLRGQEHGRVSGTIRWPRAGDVLEEVLSL